jgi:hypothetical protein
MTEQEKLQAQQQELQKQMDELSEKIAEWTNPKPKMFPQEGEAYCYYNKFGRVECHTATDSNGRLNVYKTKEETEKARDIQWAKQRVAHAIAIENGGWKPDWGHANVPKYFFFMDLNNVIHHPCSTTKYQPSYMYMKSKEVAEKISAEHKEDLLLILSE